MPRVVSVRVLGVWIAFVVDDYGQEGKPYLAFSKKVARHKAAEGRWLRM